MERLGDRVEHSVRPWLRDQQEALKDPRARSWGLLARGYELLGQLEMHEDSLKEIVSASLWARCLEHYQAVITLAELGLIAPAQVALRAQGETMFTLRAIANDEAVLTAYLAEDDLHRLRLLRKAKRVQDPRLRVVDSEFEAELEAAVRKSGARPLGTEDLAKTAGLHDWYLVVYALLTGPAHTKIRDLEAYIREHPGGILEFAFQRSDAEFLGVLSTAGAALLGASEALEAVFGKQLADGDAELAYFLRMGDAAGTDASGP